MIRIICAKCKNAYLQKADGNLSCPNCEAVFPEKDENLLLGAQYYNEGDYENADNCLMKYIVQEGAEPRAIFLKALCDASQYDEDTYSLKGMYDKLCESLCDIPDEWFISFLAMANDEAEKIEKSLVEKHIDLFEDADAEKIKKEVTTIITLQNDAKDFRKKLTELAESYNERSEAKISVRFSECFLVEPEKATEVGERKYAKITNNIASHTVFTGSLSTDIKNLEIYYRCIVMFFRRNRQKYDFLMAIAEKFSELSRLLEEGQYHTIKGTASIGDKLKSAAYDFFQESLKDHDEDENGTDMPTVTVIEPEVIEIPEEAAEESPEEEKDYENIYSVTAEESAEAEIVYEDISSDSSAEENIKETAEADETEEAAEEVAEEISEAVSEDVEKEVTEEAIEEVDETVEIISEEISEEAEEDAAEATAEEIAEIESVPSVTATLTKIDKTKVDVIPDDEKEDAEESLEEDIEEDTVEINEDTPKKKHKKNYAPFVAIFLIIIAVAAILAVRFIPPKLRAEKYGKASEYAQQEQYDKAAALYLELGGYEDSEKLYLENTYAYASQLETHKKYAEAKEVYAKLGDYLNSAEKVKFCIYSDALEKLNEGKYDEAKTAFDSIADYKDSTDQATKCLYKKAEALISNHNFTEAVAILETITSYDETVNDMILDAQYRYVKDHLDPQDETTMIYIVNLVSANYLDSVSLRDFLVSGQEPTVDPDGSTEEDPDTQVDTPVVDTPEEGSITAFTNSSKTDTETNTTEFDNDNGIYFHVNCTDESLYGQKLYYEFETSVGYRESGKSSVTFEEDYTSHAWSYTGDSSNYSIIFRLVDADGNVVAEQTVSVK